jgi:Family of unknown function (DUF5689)
MHRMFPKHVSRFFLALPFIALLSGCDKEFDSPPRTTPGVGDIITIAELKSLFTLNPVHFDSAMSVYAVVNSDENDGNFYKNVYVQDATGGLCLRLMNSGGLYIGDSIRIYLPGTVLAPYNGLMQLDSVDVDVNVVKQATLRHIEPLHLTIDQLDPVDHQSMLVQLDSVEFITAQAIGSTWADPVNQQSVNLDLEDCNGNQILVRTSGYANYAGQLIPQGKGSFLGVLGVFGSDLQLYARTVGEVLLNGPRCPGEELPFFSKNFQDQNLTSGGWTEQVVLGSTYWGVQDLGSAGNFYAYANNYTSGVAAETWLISPAIDITGVASPALSFQNACNFNGPLLEVYVSTDYQTGNAPGTATWTAMSPVLSAGAYAWVNSGLLDISAFSSANFRVAFKYVGTDSDGRAWEVDDIKVIAQ